MQKKLIALAVASALSIPAVALADTGNVTIFGSANVSYDFVDSGNLGQSSQRVSSNVSNIGLKGSEDLGGGLTAVWQVQQEIDISGASSSVLGGAPASGYAFATMNSFVGLSSATMGTVVLGRHDTPYKIATRGLDQFADGIADNRSLMGVSTTQIALRTSATAFDGRQPDVIAYISPAMAGLTVAVGHVNLNQAIGESQALAGDTKAAAWSLAGLYGNGPFFASVAYEKHDLGTGNITLPTLGLVNAGGLNEKAWKLGLGYTQEAFNVGLVYEKTSDNMGGGVCTTYTGLASAAGSDCGGHNAWYLGGKYNISASDAVKLGYSRMGNLAVAAANGANTSANQWSLGYDHSMSKRTTVYALYTRLNNNTNGAFGFAGTASAANTFNAAGTTVAGAGSDPSALSIGLKHSF